MIGWVRSASEQFEVDAYQLVAQSAKASIIHLVDPEHTVLVKMVKDRLPTEH